MTESNRVCILQLTAQEMIDAIEVVIDDYYPNTNTFNRWDSLDEEDKLEYVKYFCEKYDKEKVMDAYISYEEGYDNEESILWSSLKLWSQRTVHDDDGENEDMNSP
jgi:hypothetical protein